MIYAFADFELDTGRAELRENGKALPVEPQVFALVAYLLEHRERLVSRDELFEKLWAGRVVSDSALASRIKSARQVLGDDGRSQRFIRTVHGKGLRFVADAQAIRPPAIDAPTDDAPEPESTEHNSTCRPSIAVLPFRTIGDAGVYASIAEGLPHELIAELSRLRWLFVVARASSFRIRGGEIDSRQVRDRLGVRYYLSGVVEFTGRKLAVTTELVDTRGGDVVWAERYEGRLDDVHAMRAEIRGSLLAQLEIQIPMHEAAAARLTVPENLDAWSAYHLGLQHIYRFNNRDNLIAAELFGRAVAQDPGFARAHAGLSFVSFQSAFLKQCDNLEEEIDRARRFAERAVDLDPLDPFVNFTMGRTYWLEADVDRALSWLERSTSISPNYAQGIYAEGLTRIFAGGALDARQCLDLAMRLSPLDPLYYAMLSARGFTHIALGEYEAAAKWSERGAQSPGAHPLIAVIAAVAARLHGDDARAKRWADEARRRNPTLTQTDFFGSFPMQDAAMRSRLASALTALGVAE